MYCVIEYVECMKECTNTKLIELELLILDALSRTKFNLFILKNILKLQNIFDKKKSTIIY